MKKKYVFFRDDDVCRPNSNFLKLYNMFKETDIPIICSVIRGKITEKMSNFLIEEKKRNPRLIDITQHGWMHKNYSEYGNEYEFGDKRNFEEQRNDILKGKIKMGNVFGDFFTEVFVPPYHGFNDNTLKIIEDLGFAGFSASLSIFPRNIKRNFLNLSVNVETNDYKSNKPYVLSLEEILKRFLFRYENFNLIGILIHHGFLKKKGLDTISKFLRILKIKENNNEIRFVTFRDILKNR